MDDYSSEGTEEQYTLHFFSCSLNPAEWWDLQFQRKMFDTVNIVYKIMAIIVTDDVQTKAMIYYWSKHNVPVSVILCFLFTKPGLYTNYIFCPPTHKRTASEMWADIQFDFNKIYKNCTLDSLISPLKQTNALWRSLSFKTYRRTTSHWLRHGGHMMG